MLDKTVRSRADAALHRRWNAAARCARLDRHVRRVSGSSEGKISILRVFKGGSLASRPHTEESSSRADGTSESYQMVTTRSYAPRRIRMIIPSAIRAHQNRAVGCDFMGNRLTDTQICAPRNPLVSYHGVRL